MQCHNSAASAYTGDVGGCTSHSHYTCTDKEFLAINRAVYSV